MGGGGWKDYTTVVIKIVRQIGLDYILYNLGNPKEIYNAMYETHTWVLAFQNPLSKLVIANFFTKHLLRVGQIKDFIFSGFQWCFLKWWIWGWIFTTVGLFTSMQSHMPLQTIWSCTRVVTLSTAIRLLSEKPYSCTQCEKFSPVWIFICLFKSIDWAQE